MYKSLAIVALLALAINCVQVHEQRFAPSTPGGSPTAPSGNNYYPPNNGGSNQCPGYPNSEQDRCLKQVGDSFANARLSGNLIGAQVNGGSYQFRGPRVIVCYQNVPCAVQRSSCQYADYCMSANECQAAIQSYGGNNPRGTRCPGQVMLFAIPQSNTNVPRR